MLIEFTIENYRSFKEKMTFSLLASSDKSLQKNLIADEKVLKNNYLLRSAVIYGPNASGKTKVLRALNHLRNHVIKSSKSIPGESMLIDPFKLDKKCDLLPCKIFIDFVYNDIRYNYELSFDREKVIDEILHYYPKGSKALIFERRNTTEYKFTIDKSKQKNLSERTLKNVLYLSNSAQQNYEKTIEPFKWFVDSLFTIGPTENLQKIDTAKLLNESTEQKKVILKALNAADLGISDIEATIEKIELQDLPDSILQLVEKRKDEISSINKVDVKFMHKGIDESNKSILIPFDFDDESEGTRKMFSLIGPWLETLKKQRILVIDELDTQLHPHLCIFLLNLFNNPKINIAKSQLIFTTHNTIFLDQDIFRRDQIWFTEKKPETGNSELYSLLEFRQRKDAIIEKGYLAGRYGAIPFILDGEVILHE